MVENLTASARDHQMWIGPVDTALALLAPGHSPAAGHSNDLDPVVGDILEGHP